MIPNGWEFVILVVLLFVLFGATKLPAAARSIGQSMRIFKAETKGLRSEDPAAAPATPPQATQAPPPVLPPPSPQASAPAEQHQRNDTGR